MLIYLGAILHVNETLTTPSKNKACGQVTLSTTRDTRLWNVSPFFAHSTPASRKNLFTELHYIEIPENLAHLRLSLIPFTSFTQLSVSSVDDDDEQRAQRAVFDRGKSGFSC